MEKQWVVHTHGTKMFKLAHKLKNTKIHLISWARNSLGNIHNNLRVNLQKKATVEEKLVAQPSVRLNSWLHRLLKQREKLLLFN